MLAREGEAYRDRLKALAKKLGVDKHIEWNEAFLETEDLLAQLEACDIYLTPYLDLQQSTSGALSYAVALGKAIVSSPYVHARELLGDGAGLLIEPNDTAAIANAVNALLDDPDRLDALQRKSLRTGAQDYLARIRAAGGELVREAAADTRASAPVVVMPSPQGFLTMCDDTGMLQHGIGIVPDRAHGYCLDDNARALTLVTQLHGITEETRRSQAGHFASFIQAAWNEDVKGFRNFMRYDRVWCEDLGSEDSNGRALWALGLCASGAEDKGLREWAAHWYIKALPHLRSMGSPRAVAFTMLGAAAYRTVDPAHEGSKACLEEGADLLIRLFSAGRRPDWAWFEAVLGYDNPRLCQALLEAGEALDNDEAREVGLDTLHWITTQQTSTRGYFRPIGSDSFDTEFERKPFDQQPLEAQAAIEAADIALKITGDEFWREHALKAWEWFFGANDRGAVLAELETGRCRDGVTPRGANENCGAESILAFHLSHYSMVRMLEGRGLSVGRTEIRRGVGKHVEVVRRT